MEDTTMAADKSSIDEAIKKAEIALAAFAACYAERQDAELLNTLAQINNALQAARNIRR